MLYSLTFRHERHAINVSIVLIWGIYLVGQNTFDEVIELVFIEVAERTSEKSMYPVGVVSTISVLEVFDRPESVSQVLSIQTWVQSVSSRSIWHHSWSSTSILLSSEVLVELTSGKLLITLRLLVLTLLKFLL